MTEAKPALRWVLLKHAALSCAVTTVLAVVVALALASPADALAAVIGSVVASLDFMAIVWIVTGLLSPTASTPSKVALAILMLGKLGFVGALLWSAIGRHGLDGIGIPLGIGAGLAGFTWGVLRAQGSREGQAAMEAEELLATQRRAAQESATARSE